MSSEVAVPVRRYRQRLVVHVVWHPGFEAGPVLARYLYDHLTRDTAEPLTRGLGIPVYYRTSPTADGLPPPFRADPDEFDEARQSVVVVLADNNMAARGPNGAWGKYLGEIWRRIGTHDHHLLLPVAVTQYAFALVPQVPESNFIRLYNTPDAARRTLRLLIDVAHELCRRLLGEDRAEHGTKDTVRLNEPVELFVSHAKKDGLKLAEQFCAWVGKNEQVRTFFDATAIPYGQSFVKVLRGKIERTALLVLQTDAYSTREWCQREILYAKQYRRPVLVVHALTTGEKRSFPYLGNTPVLSRAALSTSQAPDAIDHEAILARLLLEVLRVEHFTRHADDQRDLFEIGGRVGTLPHPPELLTLLAIRRENAAVRTFVYPDPPLGAHELELLREFDPSLCVTTPVFLLAQRERQATAAAGAPTDARAAVKAGTDGAAPPLSGRTVALSISNPTDGELLRTGHGKEHLEDATGEFARYLLAAGASLAYGGDLRPGGFLDQLRDLVLTYNATSDEAKRLSNYLAWHLDLKLTAEQQAAYASVVDLVPVPLPPDIPSTASSPAPADDPYVIARAFTAMRERMAADIDARVLLGGPVQGFKGMYPGLAEEAYLTMKAGKPVYLIGGFGGCTRAVVQAVRGGPEVQTADFPLSGAFQWTDPAYAARATEFNRRAADGVETIDYAKLLAFFTGRGVGGLANGLTPEENERLFETVHVIEMIYLVLKGLLTHARGSEPASR